jgi:hypothetical protein
MTNVEAAERRLADAAGGWVSPPPAIRVGRKRPRPWAAYATLVRLGRAETDGRGRYRVLPRQAAP